MATLVFVHGTGVRGAAYSESLDLVTRKAVEHGGHQVIGVPWGDSVGVKLLRGGVSIPDYRSTGGTSAPVEVVSEVDEMDELWQVLYQDPLYELRLLGGPAAHEPFGLGQRPLGDTLRAQVASLGESEGLRSSLAANDRRAQFERARQSVISSDEFEQAMQTVGTGETDHQNAVARAIAAYMEPMDPLGEELSAGVRDEVVAQIAADLGAVVLGPRTEYVAALFAGMAWRIVDPVLARRRGRLTDAASLAAGDILAYTLDGAEARAMVAAAMERASRPVYLLGHSLGGIISVDLLCLDEPAVEGLITVGSQSPFMYEVSAIRGLAHAESLPDGFPDWLNIYDKRDLLSYLAEPVFGTPARDVPVDNGKPFPAAHSKYWENDKVWEAIESFVQ